MGFQLVHGQLVFGVRSWDDHLRKETDLGKQRLGASGQSRGDEPATSELSENGKSAACPELSERLAAG